MDSLPEVLSFSDFAGSTMFAILLLAVGLKIPAIRGCCFGTSSFVAEGMIRSLLPQLYAIGININLNLSPSSTWQCQCAISSGTVQLVFYRDNQVLPMDSGHRHSSTC
ncbi:unnamed protein product [Caenorhabditis nigoni]